jgi:ferredoxin-NADP reductase
MKYIDNFLNKITMYRLVLQGLFVLAGVSILESLFGLLSYNPLLLFLTFFLLAVSCYVSNYVFGMIFKVALNIESSSITALILYLLVFPVSSTKDVPWILLLGVVAMASKYALAWKKKHIFNPTAIGLVILGLFGVGLQAWWVGSSAMLIPVAILGFLVLRKVQRFQMFGAYIVGVLVSTIVVGLHNGDTIPSVLSSVFISGPAIFLGAIMLTEPLTTPPQAARRLIYGLLVGLLYGVQFDWGILYMTPALALVIGNLFSYIASPRERLMLTLVRKEQRSPDIYDFAFSSDRTISFLPGQYLEWTLGLDKADTRGNRRYFTIASSPTEKEIILGTKFYDKPSAFKQKLLSLSPGAKMIASQLSGGFTLPGNEDAKLAFIAGGIGITPFRSMAKYLLDKEERRDVVMLYSAKSQADLAYKHIFDDASSAGFRTVYVVNEAHDPLPAENMRQGFITKEMIEKEIPDYKERTFYISGTRGMTVAVGSVLRKLGVHESKIKVDFFPGFA